MPRVTRDGEEEGGDGVDGFGLVDIFDDDDARMCAADVGGGPCKGGHGDGVAGVGAVMIAAGKGLAGRAGQEEIDGRSVDGGGREGAAVNHGREEAAAAPGVTEEGTEATAALGGV